MDELNKKDNSDDSGNNGDHLGGQLPERKEITPVISPVSAAFIGLFGGFFLYQIVGGFLTILVFGFHVESAPVNSVRLMTIAGQILFILLPALIFAKVFYEDVTHIIRVKLPKWNEILIFLLGMIILSPMLQYYLAIQTYLIDMWAKNSSLIYSIKSALDSLNDLVEKTYGNLLEAHSVFEGILVIIAVSIIPALCEETMFRGFIQKSFEFKMKPVWAAAVTAAFFALYHFNPYGLVPLAVLGFYFGFAAYKSESIFVPMSLHFFNNFTAVIFYFLFGDEDFIKATPSNSVHLPSSIIIFFALLILFIGLILLIKRFYSNKSYS